MGEAATAEKADPVQRSMEISSSMSMAVTMISSVVGCPTSLRPAMSFAPKLVVVPAVARSAVLHAFVATVKLK